MESLQEKYLNQISSELFIRFNASDIEKEILKKRWLPKNKHLKHTKIIESIEDERVSNEHIKRVGEKIKTVFQDEIEADGFDLDKMQGQNRFPLTFEWLWQYKFPREAWQFMQDTACFLPHIKTVNRPVNLPINPNKIQVNEPYRFDFKFERDGYLLLINQSYSGDKYLFAPSHFFADIPVTKFMANQFFSLPWKDEHYPLSFDAKGEEYFLIIITENPIELSWVYEQSDPNDEVELNEKRLQELFSKVAHDKNTQVFYRKLIIF